MATALVTVVSGEAYERYAANLFASAHEFFHPDPVVAHIVLPGREGWPAATLYRYHALLQHERVFNGFDHVFLCDADMRFEAPVGPEILGEIVATEHPGFVNRASHHLPYERRPTSCAYVPIGKGEKYYAGGFVGGVTEAFFNFADVVVASIDCDDADGTVAVWHDESHLNGVLCDGSPSVILSPSYCYPDDDSSYDLSGYERKLVALDKTPAERGVR